MTNHIFKHPFSAAISSMRYDQRHLYNIARRQRRRLLKIEATIEQALATRVFSLNEVLDMKRTIEFLQAQDSILSDLQNAIGQSYQEIQERTIRALNLCDPEFGKFNQQLRTYNFPSPVVPPKKGDPL